MLKLFFKYLKPWHYLSIALAVVLIYVNVRFDLKIPEVTQGIITIIRVDPGNTQEIWKQGIEMLLYTLGTGVLTILIAFIASRVGTDFAKILRGEIFTKVSGFTGQEMEQFGVPSLITRSTNDVLQVQMILIFGIRLLVNAPITAFLAIRKISSTDMTLSGVVAAAVILIIILIVVVFTVVYPKVKIMQQKTDNLNMVTRESLMGVRVIRAHNAEKEQEQRFGKTNKELRDNYYFVNVAMSFMGPAMDLIMRSVSLVIPWVASFLFVSNSSSITPDALVTFPMFATRIIMSFIFLIMLFILIPRAMISAKRINQVLDAKSTIAFPETSSEMDKNELSLVFDNVSFAYPEAQANILTNVSFNVKAGETIAIIGGTGSGKSSLINLIPRFFDPTTGSIKLNNVNINELTEKDLNSLIGYVPQQGYLFRGSIDYNVKLGIPLSKVAETSIDEALRVANADEFVNKLPDKLEHQIVQGGTNVSGGQRQRIAIARAIAKKPKIYIFDDSFSALDYQTDKFVREELKKITKDAINVIVAQRVGTIIDADQIIVLDKGVVVGHGNHKELLKTSKEYQEIAYSQLSEEEFK